MIFVGNDESKTHKNPEPKQQKKKKIFETMGTESTLNEVIFSSNEN